MSMCVCVGACACVRVCAFTLVCPHNYDAIIARAKYKQTINEYAMWEGVCVLALTCDRQAHTEHNVHACVCMCVQHRHLNDSWLGVLLENWWLIFRLHSRRLLRCHYLLRCWEFITRRHVTFSRWSCTDHVGVPAGSTALCCCVWVQSSAEEGGKRLRNTNSHPCFEELLSAGELQALQNEF